MKRIFKVLDWFAEFPRWMSVWSPAELMSPCEYGFKLLLGIAQVVTFAAFAFTLVGLITAGGAYLAVMLVIHCPYIALAIACVVISAIGIGWLRKKEAARCMRKLKENAGEDENPRET